MSPRSIPVATISAYRKTGHAIVTVEREGRPPHRYRVTLRRYHALRGWILFGRHGSRTSGAWLKSSFCAVLWAGKEVTEQTAD